ncbi:c-type cytochrome [Halorhodospira halophila]|uniref:Putative cytochrome c n=1 Tax=Halorhodospira halophila (strain DSM 244 / SL1) TaxID=349124 RepID=A1WW82_HALHL|nr:c-type cytochrome [Halorhodospira halophila]ABM61944.1 putative cytochrome c [Halorhodospira halophila SL1]MBK1729728.1 hypothetical protein [Halorhodospira halophila]
MHVRYWMLALMAAGLLALAGCNDSSAPDESPETDEQGEAFEAAEDPMEAAQEDAAPPAEADHNGVATDDTARAEEEAVAQPVASHANEDNEDHPGLAIYRSGTAPSCRSCHDRGIAGAPVTGQEADWADRSRDLDELLDATLRGKGAMPAYRGRADEDDLIKAIEYMLSTLEDA